MRLLVAILLILCSCAACGNEQVPSPRPETRPEVPTRPEGVVPPIERRRPSSVRPGEDRPKATPIPAHELYAFPTSAGVLEGLRTAADVPAPMPSAPDDVWSARVRSALQGGGITASSRARRIPLEAGVLDLVEALGERAEDEWVVVERWRGEPSEEVSARAALYLTPVARAGMFVESLDIPGLQAYRCNLDDPARPTIAWSHRGLFVKLGASSASRAAALHAALEREAAYGAATEAPGAGDPPSAPTPGRADPAADPHARLVGSWTTTQEGQTYHLDIEGDGTWSMANPQEAAQSASGNWLPTNSGYRLHTRVIGGEAAASPEAIDFVLEGDALVAHPENQPVQTFTRRRASVVDAPPGVDSTIIGAWAFRTGDRDAELLVASDGTWRTFVPLDRATPVSTGTWTQDGEVFTFAHMGPDGEERVSSRMVGRVVDGKLVATDSAGDVVTAVRVPSEKFEESFGDTEGLSDSPFAAGPLHAPFGGRAAARIADRDSAVGQAMDQGLRWLAAHQAPSGAWGAADFGRWCDGEVQSTNPGDGAGKAAHDVGVTGLALQAYLGAGYTNRGKSAFSGVVARGLRYLKGVQDDEGCFGPRTSAKYVYGHAMATIAMIEAYGLTQSEGYEDSAQRALDFIALARNPYFAWRYGIKPGDNDLSVSGWMMLALESATFVNQEAQLRGEEAPFLLDESADDGVKAWLQRQTDPDYGHVGYEARGTGPWRPGNLAQRFPAARSESMTALGAFLRIGMGEDPRTSAVLGKGLNLVARKPPVWDSASGDLDMYYWHWGALAMRQAGGRAFEVWQSALERAVVAHQRRDGDACGYKGSWDPLGPWGSEGGRVYSTALLTMCLQARYHYSRLLKGR